MFVTYELNPLYPYWQLTNVLLALYATFVGSVALLAATAISFGVYFLVSFGLGRTTAQMILSSITTRNTEIQGSKFSFSHPLRYKIPRMTIVNPAVEVEGFTGRLFGQLRMNLRAIVVIAFLWPILIALYLAFER